MTPTDEAEFIALWTQGLEIAEIAQRLGILRGTVQSRAHRLQQRGLAINVTDRENYVGVTQTRGQRAEVTESVCLLAEAPPS
jgi:DNA-binding NarL/FixJ family response regulator